MTKTDEALFYFNNEEYKKAFKIFKTFKLNFSKKDSKQICRVYEMFTNKKFYEQLGFNFNEELNKGKQIIRRIYAKRFCG